MQTKIVTAATLQRLGACDKQVKKFRTLFGTSVEITSETCASVATEFDWDWAAHNLLSDAAWAEYARVHDAAWAEYERVRDAASAEYERVRAAASAEYERVCAIAFADGVKQGLVA